MSAMGQKRTSTGVGIVAMAAPTLARPLHPVGQYGWTSVQRDFDDYTSNLRLMGSGVAPFLEGCDVGALRLGDRRC
jgi:hypothetical protein